MSSFKKTFLWIGWWSLFVVILLLVDTYFFQGKGGDEIEAAIIPVNAQAKKGEIKIEWLGPPYFAGATEGTWVETMLEERFNIELNPIFLDPNGYSRKKPLMIASGSVPDVIWEADTLGLQSSIKHGFLAQVPFELIAKYMPIYYKDLTNEAPLSWMNSGIGGKNFGIPTMSRSGAYPKPGVWRIDWLESVGVETAPQTLEEFHDVLHRFTYNDPDQNGIDDTYGMSGDISNWWWVGFSEIFGAFGTLPFDWQHVDGKIVYGGVRDETRQALKVLSEWYAEGIIHPDFVTDSMLPGSTLDKKFMGGKVGYAYYRGDEQSKSYLSSGSFAAKFLNLQFPSILEISPTISEELFSRIPDAIIDLFYTLELNRFLENPDPAFKDLIAREIRTKALELGESKEEAEKMVELGIEELDSLNYNYEEWLVNFVFRDPLIFQELYTSEKSEKNRRDFNVSESVRAVHYWSFATALRQHMLTNLSQEVYEEHSKAISKDINAQLAELGLRKINWKSQKDRKVFADYIYSEKSDEVLRKAKVRLQKDGIIQDSDDISSTLQAVLLGYYSRIMTKKEMKSILEPAAFPIGPNGKRGGRVWGKPGNIITFGNHIAEQPEVAIRTMQMLEKIYTDRTLSLESTGGREDLHWQWSDPVLLKDSPFGISMKKDYLDPRSDEVVDLTAGQNGLRRMLLPRMGFFNLVGGEESSILYYDSKEKMAFLDKYQNERWGLANALGKSDVVPSAAELLGDLRRYQQTIFAEIIRGSKGIDAFDEFLERWDEKGGKILTEEANELFEAKAALLKEVESHID